MSDYVINGEILTDIADAIREKTGESGVIIPEDMSDAISDISGGGGSTLITKNITQNGTYDAEDDNADGYSSVVVNVSGGGGSAVAKVTVAYPAGSVVTATDGTTTLTSDTSGEYDFYLPNAGSWTFSSSYQQTEIINVQTYMLNFAGFYIVDSVWWRGEGETSIDGVSTIHAEGLHGRYQLAIISINCEASSRQITPTTVHVVGGTEESITLTSLLYQDYNVNRAGNTRNLRFSIGEVDLTGDDYINTQIANISNFCITIAMLLPVNAVTQIEEVRSSNDAQIQTTFDALSGVTGVIYGYVNGYPTSFMANYYCDSYSAGDTVDTGTGPGNYGAGFIFGIS